MAPYKVQENKEKKKAEMREDREGLRPRGPPDTKSGDTHAPFSQEGEQEEDREESDTSRTSKRATSDDAEEGLPPPAPKKQRRAKLVRQGVRSF